MPGHHPVPAGVAGHFLLTRPRHEREQLVEAICGRLSANLDRAVVSLKTLVKERDPQLWKQSLEKRRRSVPERSAS